MLRSRRVPLALFAASLAASGAVAAPMPASTLTSALETLRAEARDLPPRAAFAALDAGIAALTARELPETMGTALRAAREAASMADDWGDAAQVLEQVSRALIENPGEFLEPGWPGTRAVLVLAWWSSQDQSPENARHTLETYSRSVLRLGDEDEEPALRSLRAAVEAAGRMGHTHSANWVLRRALWKLSRLEAPMAPDAYLRVALHAAEGLPENREYFILHSFVERWVRSGCPGSEACRTLEVLLEEAGACPDHSEAAGTLRKGLQEWLDGGMPEV